MTRTVRCMMTFLLSATAMAAAQDSAPPSGQGSGTAGTEQVLFVNEQQTLSPDYAIGNIAIGNPAVADFKVLQGRRAVLLFGKQVGQTMLTLWDQKNVKRAEIMIRVTTREAEQVENDLKELLKDFPSVRVTMLGGNRVIAGAVSSEADLAAIEKIASAAGVQSIVRYVAPVGQPGQPTAYPPPPPGGAGGSSADPPTVQPGTTPGAAAPAYEVEYDVEVMETSVAFASGTYGQGVQPAGRRLYTGKLRTPFNLEKELFIDGGSLMPKDVDRAKRQQKRDTKAAPAPSGVGLRLRLRPQVTSTENFVSAPIRTQVVLQTNLPYEGGPYDPAVWRTARWNIDVGAGDPIGIAGGDMLAVLPAPSSSGSGGGSRIGGLAGMVGGMPGVNNLPGAEYAGAASTATSLPQYFDKQKKTHLLLLLTPRLVTAAQQ